MEVLGAVLSTNAMYVPRYGTFLLTGCAMVALQFLGTNGTVELGLRIDGQRGDEDFSRLMAINIRTVQDEATVQLDDEGIDQFLSFLEDGQGVADPFSWDGEDVHFEAQWSSDDSGGRLLRLGVLPAGNSRGSGKAATILALSGGLGSELAEYIRLSGGDSGREPGIFRRLRLADELAGNGNEKMALAAFDDEHVDGAVRIIGNLGRRRRIDLAVELLDRLYQRGLIDGAKVRAVETHYEAESLKAEIWADLLDMAGIPKSRPWATVQTEPNVEDNDYSAADYCQCFELAFENRIDRIDFANMNLFEEQGRLRRLAENLEKHYEKVKYSLQIA